MQQQLDPNWFYSSFAQSAAALVALLFTVVFSRLQQQIVAAGDLQGQLRRAVAEFNRQFKRAIELGEDFLAWVEKFERAGLSTSTGHHSVVIDEERWLTGSKPLGDSENRGFTDRDLIALKVRKDRAVHALSILAGLQRTTTLAELEAQLPLVKSEDAQLLADPLERDFLQPVISSALVVIDIGARLGAQQPVSIPVVVAIVALSMWCVGVLAPLAKLSAFSASERSLMLALFTVLVVILPVAVVVEVVRLRKMTKTQIQISRSVAASNFGVQVDAASLWPSASALAVRSPEGSGRGDRNRPRG